MGLTIHYDFKFKGTEAQAKARLEAVREAGKALKEKGMVAFVADSIWELDYSKSINDDAENAKQVGEKDKDTYRWAKIQYEPRGRFTEKEYIPEPDGNKYKGYVVCIWQGQGCESTNIGLVSKDGVNWSGGAFTKTQYAVSFLKAHLTVVAILDFCKTLGILEKVSDEGDYWESRDLKTLGKNINESTMFLQKLKGMFGGMGMENVESGIDKCKNFVHIKEGGTQNERRDKKNTSNRRF